MKFLTALFLLLSLVFAGHSQTPSPAGPALQILCRLHSTAIPPDDYSWVRLTDAKTGQDWKVFWFCGGPGSKLPEGAVGYFNPSGILMGAKRVGHLEGLVRTTSALRDNDSLIFTTLEGDGTGIRDESIIVLTLYGGEWLETFHCVGNYYSNAGFGEVSNREVAFPLEGTTQNDRGRLVRKVVENQYLSNEAYHAGKPSKTKRSTQTYAFDPAKMRFIETKKNGRTVDASNQKS